jgi:hypothetical protein
MRWIYDPNLQYAAPDVRKRMYDGRVLFGEYDRDEETMYYNYIDEDHHALRAAPLSSEKK